MKDFEKQLKKDLPDFEISSHKKALKGYLLSEYSKEYDNENRSYLSRGGEYTMNHKFITYAASAFVVIALALGVFTVAGKPFRLQPKTAEAQEIINKSLVKIIDLSDAEQKKIEQRFKSSLESSLKEARAAKDLEIVPESEIKRIDAPSFDEAPAGPKDASVSEGQLEHSTDRAGAKDIIVSPEDFITLDLVDGKIPVRKGISVLRYINPEGKKFILGIDQNDKPEFRYNILSKEEKEKLDKEAHGDRAK